jgi:hypothetical protein
LAVIKRCYPAGQGQGKKYFEANYGFSMRVRMRKRVLLALFCALVFFAGWASGQKNLDASNWNDLGKTDNLARLTYVHGYVRGYSDGVSAATKNTSTTDSATKKLTALLRVSEVVGLGKNHELTAGKIADTVTTFYDDYRNAPVCWNQAIQFSIWSMSGDAATVQETDAARKSGAENGCQ